MIAQTHEHDKDVAVCELDQLRKAKLECDHLGDPRMLRARHRLPNTPVGGGVRRQLAS